MEKNDTWANSPGSMPALSPRTLALLAELCEVMPLGGEAADETGNERDEHALDMTAGGPRRPAG